MLHNAIFPYCNRFEDLRIRREKKKEGRKTVSNVDKSVSRDTKSDKLAFLLFTAEVETSYERVTCTAISSPISLSKYTLSARGNQWESFSGALLINFTMSLYLQLQHPSLLNWTGLFPLVVTLGAKRW